MPKIELDLSILKTPEELTENLTEQRNELIDKTFKRICAAINERFLGDNKIEIWIEGGPHQFSYVFIELKNAFAQKGWNLLIDEYSGASNQDVEAKFVVAPLSIYEKQELQK